MNVRNMFVDEHAVRELSLWSQNDESVYRQKHVPFVKNYAKKIKKKIYDRQKAEGGIERNYVPVVVKSYSTQFGKFPINKATKKALAKEITDLVEQDARDEIRRNQ